MTTRVTRKQFLSTLAAGFAGAVLRPARALAAPLTLAPRGSEGGLLPEAFQKHVGTTFRVFRPSGGSVEVVLTEVVRKPDSNGTVQYSLTFVAPSGETIAEQAQRFEHADLGTLSILVVKTRVDPQGQAWYRADFNLLQEPQNTRKTRTLPVRG